MQSTVVIKILDSWNESHALKVHEAHLSKIITIQKSHEK